MIKMGNQKITDEQILSKINYETLGWIGGKTAVNLSQELKISESAIRNRLNRLDKENRIYSCQPKKIFVGGNGHTQIWFKGDSNITSLHNT
jgi:predicted ArsR family transcriptional regulator